MPISSHLKINGKFINHRKNAEVLGSVENYRELITLAHN